MTKQVSLNISKAALALALIIFLYCQFQKYEYSPDDTYIYLKYSKNLSSGNGFSFNSGEPSYGVTGPLWALLLVIPFVLSVDAFWFAKYLDIILMFLSFAVFFRLTRFFFKENSLRYLSLSVFVINPWIIRSTFTGMETSIAIFVILCAFLAYYSDKYELLFLLLGLSVLIRPEGFLLFLLFLTLVVLRFRKKLKENFLLILKYLGCACVFLIPFAVFSFLSFGTIIPNTFSGKTMSMNKISTIYSVAEQVAKTFLILGPVEVMGALISVVMLAKKRGLHYYLPIVLWVAVLPLLYISTGASVLSRYFLILYPMIVLLCIKFFEVVEFKTRLILTLMMLILFVYSQVMFANYVKPYTDGFTEGVKNCLIPIGQWLNANTDKESRILASDVGAIGYYADRYIIDGAALINRDLELNKKILETPPEERNHLRNYLKFIEVDYLVEIDTSKSVRLKSYFDFEFDACQSFAFSRIEVFYPLSRFYTIYKVKRKAD